MFSEKKSDLETFAKKNRGKYVEFSNEAVVQVLELKDSKKHAVGGTIECGGLVERNKNCYTMHLRVFGEVKRAPHGVLCGDPPILMKDFTKGFIYVFDGECMHLVADSMKDLCQNGLRYPSEVVLLNESAVNYKLDFKRDPSKFQWNRGI